MDQVRFRSSLGSYHLEDGLVSGLSPWGSKNETGPNFKTLVAGLQEENEESERRKEKGKGKEVVEEDDESDSSEEGEDGEENMEVDNE